jgi:hypothetical protein
MTPSFVTKSTLHGVVPSKMHLPAKIGRRGVTEHASV